MGHGHLKTELERLKDNLTDSVVNEEPIDENAANALKKLVDFFIDRLDDDQVIFNGAEFTYEVEQMLK